MILRIQITKRWIRQKFLQKSYWKEILALLVLLLSIVFFRSERKELHAIIPHLMHAKPLWSVAGFMITVFYILLQAGIYKKSFAAVNLPFQWNNAAELFLKRNFISVFLPAGGISSFAYTPSSLRKSGFTSTQMYQASALFAFAGLLTVLLAGFPVGLVLTLSDSKLKNGWIGLTSVTFLLVVLFYAIKAVKTKSKLSDWIASKFPSFVPVLNELLTATVNRRQFTGAVLYSFGVELCGVLHVYVAMLALNGQGSIGIAVIAYIVATSLMMLSPFLKGLGLVELSMVYILQRFGYPPAQALSITMLYRVFEFWTPLAAGFISFAWKGRQLFLRTAPAFLIFALGLINIVSAISSPVYTRMHLLKEYLPLSVIHASHLLVLFAGLTLLVTSASLFRGLRNAWIIALALSLISLIAHLTKALDYEEAFLAAVTALVLICTSSQYCIRSSNKWMQSGLRISVISFVAIGLFSFISLYLVDKKHFGTEFTWQQAIQYSLNCFLLTQDRNLHPVTRFGHELIWLTRVLCFSAWLFLLFVSIRLRISKPAVNDLCRQRAKALLEKFGNSSIDYFKIYHDKFFFFSEQYEAFLAYRLAGSFAIVLAEPVCCNEHKTGVLREFDEYCRKVGIKPAFYRVDETSLPLFDQVKKHKLLIGQEAVLDAQNFSLEGRSKKSLRNGLNNLEKNGYKVRVHSSPHSKAFISELKKVSNEWLMSFSKREIVFSQGMFEEKELQYHDIITVEDECGNIKAFLNIIPDYTSNECTYDMIRKTHDAPAGAMDALIIKLIDYAKAHKKPFINLGLVPMCGVDKPANTAEQIIKLAARTKRFQHYNGLKEFKEKYVTLWENKYLVYDNDFDLLQLPLALNRVMRP